MADKRRDATQPTIYLDTSTISDAFKAHGAAADQLAAFRPLLPWCERVAQEANLCMSVMHLAEFSRWGDVETADKIARWVDATPIVWLGSMAHRIQTLEAQAWTRIAVGADAIPAGVPFCEGLAAAFKDLTPAAERLLSGPEPALRMVRDLRPSADWTARWEGWRTQFVDWLMVVVEDHRAATEAGWSEGQKRAQQARNDERELRKVALAADTQLLADGDEGYLWKRADVTDVGALLLGLYHFDPRALPLFRLGSRFNAGAIARAMRGRQDGGVASKSVRKELGSAFGDYVHLAGGAYCDVFTCDGAVASWIDDVREKAGLRRQVTARNHPGGPAGFVAELIASVP